MTSGFKCFTSFYFTVLASSMHNEVKIEVKNKVLKAFESLSPNSVDGIVHVLSLIWNVKEVESYSSSSQNDPCAKLKMKPSFFKINLPGTITKNASQEVDMCLPPHESESGMKYNPFYDDPPFKETVSLVQQKLTSYPHDITVLAGVSGGGKTSTAFGISIQHWSIYIDFSPSGGQYGDFMGPELESIRAKPPKYGEYQTSEQIEVFKMLDLAIIARGLLLIKMLVQERISTPKEWLFEQLQIGINYIGAIKDILRNENYISLPFLSHDDVLRNLEAVIDLTDVTPKTRDILGNFLKGRPRNCASLVRELISNRKPTNRTKDQEMRELIRSWFEKMSTDMADYLEDACNYVGADNLYPEKAIMDVLRLRVFYNQKFRHAIKLLQNSIIPCESPECIVPRHDESFSEEITINPSFESYLIPGIEAFFQRRGKSLVDVFVDNIILLNNNSSIGNEFDAVFITAIIQKRGCNVRDELNKWKNGQQFDLPSWITSTMRFVTISNLSNAIPLARYVSDETYCRRAIQPEPCSGSDLVVSLVDNEQNILLLSASCTVSGKPIERNKVEKQLAKSCFNFQYMEVPRKRKNSEPMEFSSYRKQLRLQIGIGKIPAANEEDDLEEDDLEEGDLGEGDLEEKEYEQDLDFDVELPRRRSKRSKLFRINEYGDLVIIVDDRNMEHVFGPVIKNLMETLRQRCENKEDSVDLTE
ncbi:unnamed protein product [Rhizophagus irregularis]|nr:unnamed protein product [Rhizophagus irregularis]